MELITRAQFAQLLLNGEAQVADPDNFDPKPVIKLFNPVGAGTWLLASVDPQYPDIAYGLCDLGMQSPELGTVSIEELTHFKGVLQLGIERDIHWLADKTLNEYAEQARLARNIVA